MDEAVAAALENGRSVIVPSPQRAAALALDWSRRQLAAGLTVWTSPDILTWEAWLRREWQLASANGLNPKLLCLSPAQELMVWEAALDELETESALEGLRQFAPALMRTAGRAVQDGLRFGGAEATEEEILLARALARVRKRCAAESFVILSLLPPDAISQVVQSGAPLFAGQQRLTAMQSAVAEVKWPGVNMLAAAAEVADSKTRFVRAANLESEVGAVADWCHRLLSRDGTRRLLVISALAEPGLPALGNLLWRALSADTAQQVDALVRRHLRVVVTASASSDAGSALKGRQA